MGKYLKVMMVLLISTLMANANSSFDQQRPDNVSDKRWSSLKEVIQSTKLLPEPNLVGGDGSQYGFSVAVEGNRALIGAPTMAGHGLVFVLEHDGTNWFETDVLMPNDVQSNHRFGVSVSLSGDRVLVGANGDIDNGFRLAGAAYIFDLSAGKWTQSAKFLADDGDTDDEFGFSVSLSGDVALIGAQLDNATSQDDGSAYIFTRNAGVWSQTQKLIASDASLSDRFGFSVSLSGTTAIIGAIFADGGGGSSGAAYIFDFSGTWVQTQKINSVGGTFGDNFGQSVSITGARCLVGANGDDSLVSNAGAAYVFDLNAGSWGLTQKLTANDGVVGDQFGNSVSLTTDRAIIGAFGNNGTPSQSGAAYIFDLNGTWLQTDKIVSNDPGAGDLFGSNVAISGDFSLISAYRDNDFGIGSGSSYFFENNANDWMQLSKHTGGDGAAEDTFGSSVSISGNWALVGATGDDENGSKAGAAYMFEFDSGTWVLNEKLLASDGTTNDLFGSSVSILGDRAVIGALFDDMAAINSGSAYIYDLNAGNWTESQKLVPTDGGVNHQFGASVSLFGNKVLIGAPAGTAGGVSSGVAYIFDENLGSWTETIKLSANDNAAFDQFGTSVSLGVDRALIGVPRDSDNGSASGSAYVFEFDLGSWSQSAKIKADDAAAFDFFGASVSLSGDRLLIGATGTVDNGFESGSAYVFDLDNSSWLQTTELHADNASALESFGKSVSLFSARTKMH